MVTAWTGWIALLQDVHQLRLFCCSPLASAVSSIKNTPQAQSRADPQLEAAAMSVLLSQMCTSPAKNWANLKVTRVINKSRKRREHTTAARW